MKATVESSVKYNWDINTEEMNPLMTKQLNLFNLILMVVESAQNEMQLRGSMDVITDELNIHFAFGFGANHMWVKQVLNGVVLKDRLLIVEF